MPNHQNSVKYILLRLPNWLGDSVMCSPSFEALKDAFINAQFILVGSRAACGIYARDGRVIDIYIDDTKAQICRLSATYTFAKRIREKYQIDLAITFTNHFYSALFLKFIKANVSVGFGGGIRSILLDICVPKIKQEHQVLTYALLLDNLKIKLAKNAQTTLISDDQSLIQTDKINIGINPGAAYGSAKRWEMEGFIKLVEGLIKHNFNIYVFGAGAEAKANQKIIDRFRDYDNLYDLSDKTTIESLVDSISDLDVFITNDSGPMHIADALNVPIVAMFGPTDDKDTCPYNQRHNPNNAIIINLNLPCAPCKKRVCPLKHHDCMRLITSDMVLSATLNLLKQNR